MRGIPAIQAALFGLRESMDRFETTAARIARTAPLGGDLPRDMVDLMVGQRGFQANAKTVRAADEMIGSLLDVLA